MYLYDVQSVIHLLDYPLLPKDDSIAASFSNIEIRSDTGNEKEEEHDHEGDDHDHGPASGGARGSPGVRWTFGLAIALLFFQKLY